jgi:crotonyl-CoA reductase
VVSSEEKAEVLRQIGVEHIINRKAEGYRFETEDGEPDMKEIRRFGKKIRDMVGQDPDIVFEHPGRTTFNASVIVCKRGGTVVTCASTSGYLHQYDNRHLWMRLKSIIGSHFANYNEAYQANRLVDLGMIHPILSKTYDLDQTAQGAYEMHHNLHAGKIGILVGAPEEGLGVRNQAQRDQHLDAIKTFRAFD